MLILPYCFSFVNTSKPNKLSANCFFEFSPLWKNTFLSYIDARGVLPNVETAVRIAKYLGVTVEYLVDGSDINNKIGSRELHLIGNFEKLSDKEKQAVERLIDSLI